MAIWQLDLFIIPATGTLPVLADDGWELPRWHATSTLDAQRGLVAPLGFPWFMMEDWVVFGSENGTRIDFCFDGEDEVELRLRLAVSASDLELGAVSAFAAELNGLFFDPTACTAFQPDRITLATALTSSRAAKFSTAADALFEGAGR